MEQNEQYFLGYVIERGLSVPNVKERSFIK